MLKTILVLAITALSLNVFANEPLNTNEEFASVNKLEAYVNQHPEATLESLKASSPILVQNVSEQSSVASAPVKDMPLVSGFWWGCCLGIVGLALVYFISDKDSRQTRKAVWGCLIGTLVWGGAYGFFGNPLNWF